MSWFTVDGEVELVRLRSGLALVGSVLLVLVVATTVGATGRMHGLRMLVPTSPGGGYDVTARTAAKGMEDASFSDDVDVVNLPGAGGMAGLGRMAGESGNGKLVMSMGLGVVAGVHTNHSPVSLRQTTPIAKLVEEPDVVVVPEDSPYRDLDQLVRAWHADPAHVRVGGGSSPGGPDHLAPMLMAEAVGLRPKQVDYVPFDGGGALLAGVLGGRVDFGVSGMGEYRDQIEAGELRVLAVTGPRRVPGLDAPTLLETGHDVRFTNWRGVVAPPGLSDDDRERLIALFARLQGTPQWQRALHRNGWTPAFQPGPEFGAFLRSESDRVAAVLADLGLTRP